MMMKASKLAGVTTALFMAAGGAMANDNAGPAPSALTFERGPNSTLSITFSSEACTRDRHLASLTANVTGLSYTETGDNKLTDQKLADAAQVYTDTLGPAIDASSAAAVSQIDSALLGKFAGLNVEDVGTALENISPIEGMQLQMAMMLGLSTLEQQNIEQRGRAFEKGMEDTFAGHKINEDTVTPEDVQFTLSVSDKPAPQCGAPKL